MDISVCAINFTEQLFLYSGANRPLYLIRNNELLEFKANKFAIGGYLQELEKKFTLHEILTQKEDTLYLSTDGYADQFSSQNKKLKTKRFKEILLSIQHLPIPEQGNYLDKFITDWRGNMEQTDDVLVIGVRV
jgi:serine phosphatase RsbU (regulator of sigma subunit)